MCVCVCGIEDFSAYLLSIQDNSSFADESLQHQHHHQRPHETRMKCVQTHEMRFYVNWIPLAVVCSCATCLRLGMCAMALDMGNAICRLHANTLWTEHISCVMYIKMGALQEYGMWNRYININMMRVCVHECCRAHWEENIWYAVQRPH